MVRVYLGEAEAAHKVVPPDIGERSSPSFVVRRSMRNHVAVVFALVFLCTVCLGLIPGSPLIPVYRRRRLSMSGSVSYDETGILLSDVDLNIISKMLSNAFDSPWFPFKAISVMDFNAQLQDRRARLVATGKQHVMMVARSDNGEVVGFLEMGLLPSANEAVLSATGADSSRKFPTIGNLVIDPGYRRRGVARGLMLRAESVAQSWGDHSHIVVAVDPANKAAVELYQSLDYQVVDVQAPQTVVRDLMQKKMDFLVLLRQLQPPISEGNISTP